MNTVARVLEMFPYGLFVVGSLDGDKPIAIIANWATQVSFQPPLVALAIENESKMRESIQRSRLFSINFLPSGAKESAKYYARRASTPDDGLAKYAFWKSGIPFVEEAAGSIGCRVIQTYQTGDHLMIVGEVVEARGGKGSDVLTLKETGWRYRR
jgi:flavin reductase (DIM6/NTAB) family NADH-FMN oxidoreductase RutF